MRSIKPEIQYATLEQQTETAQLGIWVFIATEVMFFGALIFTYVIYRSTYWEQFRIAGHDSKILNGAINEAILLTSSLTMVMAINFCKEGRRRMLVGFLLATAFLGVCFLGVKGWEYIRDYNSGSVPSVNYLFKSGYHAPTELFWIFYWIATGIHAIHLTIGIVLVLILTRQAHRGKFSPNYYSPLEVVGLYWSFVDTVWLFLFAAIYPLGRAAT
jgi:cytochrome c oxidase subunit III